MLAWLYTKDDTESCLKRFLENKKPLAENLIQNFHPVIMAESEFGNRTKSALVAIFGFVGVSEGQCLQCKHTTSYLKTLTLLKISI